MDNWIEKEAEKIKRAEDKEREDRRWQLHVTEQVKAQWASVWENIKTAIKADVAAFNAKFSDVTRQIAISSEDEDGLGLTLRHDERNIYVIQVRAFAGEGIRLTIIQTNFATSAQSNDHERIAFGIGRGTEVVTAIINGSASTPAQAAESILRHLFR